MESVWNRLRRQLFTEKENVIQQPEERTQDEIVQNIDTLSLQEQIHIFRKVEKYMTDYSQEFPKYQNVYEKGFSMKNDLFVTEGEEAISRCNVELFFQEKETAEKIVTFLISLIKFGDEEWRVFQVK